MKVRIMRVLIYEGEYTVVRRTLMHGAVPMNGTYDKADLVIHSAMIPAMPSITLDDLHIPNGVPE